LIKWDPSLEDEFEEKSLLDNPILYLSILMMLLHFLNEAFKENPNSQKLLDQGIVNLLILFNTPCSF
jgi:hypothetical protein